MAIAGKEPSSWDPPTLVSKGPFLAVSFVSLGPWGAPFSASNSRKAPWPACLPSKTPLFMLPCSTSAPREKGSVLAPSLPKQPIKRGTFERTVSKQRHRDLGCITRQHGTYFRPDILSSFVLVHKQSLNNNDSDDDDERSYQSLKAESNNQLQQPVETFHQLQKLESALSASDLDPAAGSSHLRHVKLRVACAFGVDFYMLPA